MTHYQRLEILLQRMTFLDQMIKRGAVVEIVPIQNEIRAILNEIDVKNTEHPDAIIYSINKLQEFMGRWSQIWKERSEAILAERRHNSAAFAYQQNQHYA